jgi:hypothetical protein
MDCVTMYKNINIPETVLLIIKLNSIQFFIIHMQSQQIEGKLQTQHRTDAGNYIMGKYIMNSEINYRQVLEENTLI